MVARTGLFYCAFNHNRNMYLQYYSLLTAAKKIINYVGKKSLKRHFFDMGPCYFSQTTSFAHPNGKSVRPWQWIE
jgi:hypothetical protein